MISQAAYSIALEGVSRFSLETAARKILQGHLKHAFFPSPAEIRMVCNEVQASISNDLYRERITNETLAGTSHRQTLSPDAKARMSALWEKTKAENEKTDPEKKDNTPEAAMERLEALAAAQGNTVDWSKMMDQKPVDKFSALGSGLNGVKF